VKSLSPRDRSPGQPARPAGKNWLAALRAASLLLVLLLSLGAEARPSRRRRPPPDPRTVGLGRSCRVDHDCAKPKIQRCLKESDANGNPVPKGICVLPCAAIDEGTTKVVPGQPIDATPENVKEAKKPPPPRCPPRYQCRSAGAGVPIDLCVRE
jgi:hypothetical protein